MNQISNYNNENQRPSSKQTIRSTCSKQLTQIQNPCKRSALQPSSSSLQSSSFTHVFKQSRSPKNETLSINSNLPNNVFQFKKLTSPKKACSSAKASSPKRSRSPKKPLSPSSTLYVNVNNKRPNPNVNEYSPRKIRKELEDVDWNADLDLENNLEDIDWNTDLVVDEDSTNLNESEIDSFRNATNDINYVLDDISISDLIGEIKDTQQSHPYVGFYGLPDEVKNLLESERKIASLYDWQDNLMLKLISHQRNLVYCVPTSGGKTLVAELMILRELLLNKKNAIFVFPFVSIVQEKIRSLLPFSMELGFVIEEYANDKGTFPVKKRQNSKTLYIATIEKAHLLMTCLLEEKRLDEIGLVVVDELHMVGEGSTRGCTLESLLLLCTIAKSQNYFNARLIAMSATLSNFDDIRLFLEADIEENNFRPVELIEFIKCNDNIFKYDKSNSTFSKFKTLTNTKNPEDPENLCALILESMPEAPQLIFGPTKQTCENIVKLLTNNLPEELKKHKAKERAAMLNELSSLNNHPICEVLKNGILYGIAYHHSGLTTDEREIVENAFLNGTLCVIVCTSTLAAGVNLPAQRVIIRSPMIATEPISSSQYKQMIGRAGRTGYCDVPGESILMVKENDDREFIKSLFVEVKNQCKSSIRNHQELGISRIFLSLFHLRLVSNLKEIHEIFLKRSLFGIQFEKDQENLFVEIIDHHMKRFAELGLIILPKDEESEIKLTKMGKGAIKGLIDVNKCKPLHEDLKRLSANISSNSIFHLLYVCTFVFDLSELPNHPNTNFLQQEYTKLNDEDKKTAKLMKITEPDIIRYCLHPYTKNQEDVEAIKRFFFTLIIYNSYKGELTLAELSEHCQIARGTLQQLFNRFASNAMSMLRFIEELNDLWGLRLLINRICSELSLCANPEIIPLLDLPHVKRGRAKLLYNGGFKTLDDIAKAKPEELRNCFDNKIKTKDCQDMIKYAKQVFKDRADILRADIAYFEEMGNA